MARFLMETLFHATPLVAGFMIAIESVAWTVAAIAFAGAATVARAGVDPVGSARDHGRNCRLRPGHA
jgi:hypothetical protein